MPGRAMITDPEGCFAKGCGRCGRFATADCSTRRWLDGLPTLRRIAHGPGPVETAQWGHPVCMHAGRTVAILGAVRGDFRLTFFNAARLCDPEGVVKRLGPNTRHPDCLRFTANETPARLEPVIRACLAAAMSCAEQGLLPPKEPRDADLPAELVEALDADPVLAEACATLTPGRQKSWALHLSDAKTSATRLSRIEKGRTGIIAGKGARKR